MRYGLTALAALTVLAACSSGGGDDDGGGSTTQFSGILSGSDGLTSGSISLTVETNNPSVSASPVEPALVIVQVSGTLHVNGGAAITLTGTYDTDTHELVVTGGGYAFSGIFDGVDRLEGTWTGPGGTSGTFVTTRSTDAEAFCGTYEADDESDAGTFSLVVSEGIVRGEAVSSDDGSLIPLDGIIASNDITIYVPGSTSVVLAEGQRVVDGGTVTVSGTFDDHDGTTGTWSGGACD